MKRVIFAAALLLLASVPAFAQCAIQNFQVTKSPDGRVTRFTWTPVPGAFYTFEEFRPGTDTPINTRTFTQPTGGGSLEIRKRTNFSRTFEYRLTADAGGSVCRSERVAAHFEADPALAAALNRAAIPIVGSTPGAYGSQWRTYVKIIATEDNQVTRLVFHPAGVLAGTVDAEATLTFAKAGDSQEWNDVVQELFRRNGLGTVDIYPLTNKVPIAMTRIYNDGPSGRIGAFISQVQPADYAMPTAANALEVQAPGPNFRLNIGLRTFDYSSLAFIVRGADGVVKETRVRTFLGDQVVLATVEDLVGIPLSPGDTLRITPVTGAVVPFYSLIDNSSNDPAYFMPVHPVLTEIPYVELPL